MGGWRGGASAVLSGLTMGAAFAGNANGITLRTGCNGRASYIGAPTGSVVPEPFEVSVVLSNYLIAASNVSMIMSFPVQMPLKVISISGLRFSSLNLSFSRVSLSYLNSGNTAHL